MCMFCAAIPMSLSLGTAMAGKQAKKLQNTEAQSKVLVGKPIPIGKVTIAVTGGLIICSGIYHLVIMPHTGAVI